MMNISPTYPENILILFNSRVESLFYADHVRDLVQAEIVFCLMSLDEYKVIYTRNFLDYLVIYEDIYIFTYVPSEL